MLNKDNAAIYQLNKNYADANQSIYYQWIKYKNHCCNRMNHNV